MSKNVKIDGRECSGISSIQAFDVDTNEYVSFVDTSDATATADDILKDKTAYANGEKIIGTGKGGGTGGGACRSGQRQNHLFQKYG